MRPRRGAHPWQPGLDPRAERHLPQPSGAAENHSAASGPVLVVGGGIAGLAAATGLAERGVDVVVVEREATLGGRVRSWPVAGGSASDDAGATSHRL
ncbi:FAD-dependent oxidoreductase, partial [Terrabacter terrae]|uniref:FAD-dependent oxidoreductase n=1 Tax=Terrabacter terrae TaxID=318434 RepID=UPI0031DB56DC